MVLDHKQQQSSDDLPYLTRGRDVLEDALLEGQSAARSVLRNEIATPVPGVLAFVLPFSVTGTCGDLGIGARDELIVEPKPEYVRRWVRNHRHEVSQSSSGESANENMEERNAHTPHPSSPLQILSQPNVRGISLENTRPSHFGLQPFGFLSSLTNGDVKKICARSSKPCGKWHVSSRHQSGS